MNQTELNAILDEHENYIGVMGSGERADFTGAVFANASFSDRNLAGVIFGDAQFPSSNFTGCYMAWADFGTGDFTSCNFTGANAAYADRNAAVFTNSNINDALDVIMLPESFEGIPEGSHAVCRADGVWTVRCGHNVFTVEDARAHCSSFEGGEPYIAALDWLEANHNVGQI